MTRLPTSSFGSTAVDTCTHWVLIFHFDRTNNKWTLFGTAAAFRSKRTDCACYCEFLYPHISSWFSIDCNLNVFTKRAPHCKINLPAWDEFHWSPVETSRWCFHVASNFIVCSETNSHKFESASAYPKFWFWPSPVRQPSRVERLYSRSRSSYDCRFLTTVQQQEHNFECTHVP